MGSIIMRVGDWVAFRHPGDTRVCHFGIIYCEHNGGEVLGVAYLEMSDGEPKRRCCHVPRWLCSMHSPVGLAPPLGPVPAGTGG